jgi:hypothetical protein
LNNKYSVAYLLQYFEPYLFANNKTEKPVLHISLNPDPKDKVSDEGFKKIAAQYMQAMGYGNQPFIVFKHTDIERTHIHIVSACVDLNGKKISDSYDRPRSMKVCRELEQQYNLIPAAAQKYTQSDTVFQPVKYKAGNIKSQMAAVVRYLPQYYRFQNIGAYNALLSLFNITAEEVKSELYGKPKEGLVYFALNEQGKKTSNPFKASLFGKNAGYTQLQKHFEQSKENMKNHEAKTLLQHAIEIAIHTTSNENNFKQQLAAQGINVVVRKNSEGRMYGITFIDHHSKTVWNGSQLGKEFSANVFNDWWNNNRKPEVNITQSNQTQKRATKTTIAEKNILPQYPVFDFMNTEQAHQSEKESNWIAALGGWLPQAQGEDYEETAFANRMKKKKKSIVN